jgi:pantoate--beta-alanine ligase
MKVLRSIDELRKGLSGERAAGHTIGLVPTMGALHEGHLSLVRAAGDRTDAVVVSIFVNPLQFGPGEDYAAYPRDEEGDVKRLDDAGASFVFLPGADEMFPPGRSTTVSAGRLGEIVEGAHRPGHFDGVCTVVAKLFNIAGPHLAFFGQKDAQQVAVLKRMVEDLDFPLEVLVCPTVREPDGLAMSSRNDYLHDSQRADALALYRALRAGVAVLEEGGDHASAEGAMKAVLAAAGGVTTDYARAVDPGSFGPPVAGNPVLLVVAARVGPARLIDNVLWESE